MINNVGLLMLVICGTSKRKHKLFLTHSFINHYTFLFQGYLKVDITVLGKGDPAKVCHARG